MAVTNALAYTSAALVTTVKKFNSVGRCCWSKF